MNVIEKIITKFTEKTLADMESISDEISHDADLSIIEVARKDLKNKELYKRLHSRGILLSVLRGLF